MEDIVRVHQTSCPSLSRPLHAQLSLDGVQESKSGGVSLDTYSLNFMSCRTVYPFKIVRPCNKHKYNEQRHIKQTIDDLNDNHVIIDDGIFDNPKRAVVRCALSHSARYGCEYCESAAQHYIDPVLEEQVKNNILKIDQKKRRQNVNSFIFMKFHLLLLH